MSSQELFNKYRGTYISAAKDLSIQTVVVVFAYYLLWNFKDSYLSILTILFHSLTSLKTFIIFHDCGHNSYTPSTTLNKIIGILVGPLVYFPESWSYTHNTHHLSNGRENNPFDFAFNELIFFTFNDYKQMSPFYKTFIKVLLSPYMVFTVLTYIKFTIIQRFYAFTFLLEKYVNPPSLTFLFTEQLFNNIVIAGILYLQYKYSILYHCAVSMLISSGLGAFLFFNQHTYNTPYIVENCLWNLKDSGLKGSSFIKIPWALQYFTGGIEYHHIHHYNSRIPNYNLKSLHNEVVETSDLFDDIVVLSLTDCCNNTSLALYDEENKRYITFEEADRRLE